MRIHEALSLITVDGTSEFVRIIGVDLNKDWTRVAALLI
jgi:hypothetical protein